MKIDARNPPTSFTMPPPKATTMDVRSAPPLDHLLGEGLHLGEPLALLTAWKKQNLETATLESGFNALAMQAPNIFGGNNKYSAGRGGNVLAYTAQNTALDNGMHNLFAPL